MNTQEKILLLLEKTNQEYLSGQEIAKQLSISRNAIWKAIKALQNKGYLIKAIPNRGYTLDQNNDVISIQGIIKYLINNKYNINIVDSIASSNTYVKEKALNGEKEGYLLIAKEQTSGRGRLGRTFYSPSDSGLYFSLLLKPANFDAKHAVKITTIASVALCNAIFEISGIDSKIKWVNDIFINNKKVAGILTEASINLENNLLDYAILGIGINVYPPKDGFKEDIKNIATSILENKKNDFRNHLLASFLNHFDKIYTNIENNDYVNDYREKSLVIGKNVKVISPTSTKNALVLDIDDECHLVVQYDDKTISKISTGEISIRL